MNRLSTAERATIVRALVEGNSIRATCRMTGAAKGTVTRLLVDLGQVCDEYQDAVVRNLSVKRVECDEIWAFTYAKSKNVKRAKCAPQNAGDIYTFTALDPDTKLIVTWRVGKRDGAHATAFMRDLSERISGRVQITTDGFGPYPLAVANAFRYRADYAQLVKVYAQPSGHEARYSSPDVVGSSTTVVLGEPDPTRISTSYVERQNLTMRMGMRRFTRLTNGFSRKVENLSAAVALHFMHYNFGRSHISLGGRTPAQVAGLADHRWTAEEIAALLDAREQRDREHQKADRAAN